MLYWRIYRSLALLCITAVFVIGGCQSPQDSSSTDESSQSSDAQATHEHASDEPASFSEAVAQVETMKSSICKAFADGTPEDAHGLLHDVGHRLEKMPELAAKDGDLSADQMATINTAVGECGDRHCSGG